MRPATAAFPAPAAVGDDDRRLVADVLAGRAGAFERLVREHQGLFEAMAGDMNWDGEPIEGMSEADAKLLTGLRPS